MMRRLAAALGLMFVAPAQAECWGADTTTFAPKCPTTGAGSYLAIGYNCSGTMCAIDRCATMPSGLDDDVNGECNGLCAVHYPDATIDPARGLCCASIGSGGSCIGAESGVTPPRDDDDIFEGNVPAIERAVLTFAQAGGWLSVGADVVVLGATLWWSPQTVQQMRPRMLLVLLVLDALAGLFEGLTEDPTFQLSEKYEDGGQASVDSTFRFLANFFYFASFTWTTLIATHALAVVIKAIEAGSAEERRRERWYWGVMVVGMVCVWLPVSTYLWFGRGGSLFKQYFILQAATLLVEWLWLVGVCVGMHWCGPAAAAGASAEVKKYKQQVLLFLVVFFLLTVQYLAAFIINDAGDTSGQYLGYFGSQFIAYTGVANAIMWGVSRTCLISCIDTCYGDSGTSSSTDIGRSLQLPLLSHDHQQASGLSASASASPGEIAMTQVTMQGLLGSGGFGRVYAALYRGMPVAAKVVLVGKYEKRPLGTGTHTNNSSSSNSGTGSSGTGSAGTGTFTSQPVARTSGAVQKVC